jgi:hypothetical protein
MPRNCEDRAQISCQGTGEGGKGFGGAGMYFGGCSTLYLNCGDGFLITSLRKQNRVQVYSYVTSHQTGQLIIWTVYCMSTSLIKLFKK